MPTGPPILPRPRAGAARLDVERSIDVGGHKTSVSLEDEFRDALREIATLRKMTVAKLTQQIDGEHASGNLSSAIRVFVIEYLCSEGVAAGDT